MAAVTMSRIFRVSLWLAATTLVILGFALDGSTEVGHHVALILGGICVGWGLAEEERR